MSVVTEEHEKPDTVIVNQNVAPYEGAIDDFIEQIPAVVKESKDGWKTTEFWLAVVVSLLTVLDGIPLPEKYEAFVVGALGVAYALSRGLAKQGVASIEAPKDDDNV